LKQDQSKQTARQQEYVAYRRTAAWQHKRRAALERADYRCQVCDSTKQLDVHHRTYERLYRETPSDLTVLCRACHQLHHGIRAVPVGACPRCAAPWDQPCRTRTGSERFKKHAGAIRAAAYAPPAPLSEKAA
jgi:uncharacterized CHY-type Zn-finger protein